MQKDIDNFIGTQISNSTKKNYRLILKRFMESYPQLPEGNSWTRDYINTLVNSGISNKTSNYHMTVIGSFIKYTTGKRLEFDRLREKRKEVEFLTEEEIEIIKTRSDKRFLPVILFMLDTGCRVSEVAQISGQNFTTVPSEVMITGKGNKQRSVMISNVTRSFLTPGLLFGRKYTVRSIQYAMKKNNLRLGIQKHIYPHILRHTFATRMLYGGADIKDVQYMLGHEYLTTTEIYTHITPERIRDVWKKHFIEQE